MNARTPDGVVHALRGGERDGGKRVVCGLKGQQHEYANKELALVSASPTREEVTCLTCIAMASDSNNKPTEWNIKGA
jgi:hypothetical protein